MKKDVVLKCTAVALLALAVGLYAWRADSGDELQRIRIRGVALDTGEDLTLDCSPNEPAPYVNPATGKRSVYKWWFCAGCKHRFVPPLVPSRTGGLPRPPPMAVCPSCGSDLTGGWAPEDPEQTEPKGDLPLPKLPG